MKINDNINVGKLAPSTQQKPLEDVRPGEPNDVQDRTSDSSQVSSLAKQIARAKQIADQIPDIRADKVELARKRLASGFYDTPEAREVLVDKLSSMIKDTSS